MSIFDELRETIQLAQTNRTRAANDLKTSVKETIPKAQSFVRTAARNPVKAGVILSNPVNPTSYLPVISSYKPVQRIIKQQATDIGAIGLPLAYQLKTKPFFTQMSEEQSLESIKLNRQAEIARKEGKNDLARRLLRKAAALNEKSKQTEDYINNPILNTFQNNTGTPTAPSVRGQMALETTGRSVRNILTGVGLSKFPPEALLKMVPMQAALGGVLSGAFTAYETKSPLKTYQAATEGAVGSAAATPRIMGLNYFTQPIFDKALGKFVSDNPTALRKFGEIFARFNTGGVTNLLEDQLYTITTESRKPTTQENIMSYVLGGAAGTRFKADVNMSINKDGEFVLKHTDGSKITIDKNGNPKDVTGRYKDNPEIFAEDVLASTAKKMIKKLPTDQDGYIDPDQIQKQIADMRKRNVPENEIDEMVKSFEEYQGNDMNDYPLKSDATKDQIRRGEYYPDEKSRAMGVLQSDIDQEASNIGYRMNKPNGFIDANGIWRDVDDHAGAALDILNDPTIGDKNEALGELLIRGIDPNSKGFVRSVVKRGKEANFEVYNKPTLEQLRTMKLISGDVDAKKIYVDVIGDDNKIVSEHILDSPDELETVFKNVQSYTVKDLPDTTKVAQAPSTLGDMDYLYHKTTPEAVKSISDTGLKPGRDGRLYFHETLYENTNWGEPAPIIRTNKLNAQDLAKVKTATNQTEAKSIARTLDPKLLEISYDDGKTWSKLSNVAQAPKGDIEGVKPIESIAGELNNGDKIQVGDKVYTYEKYSDLGETKERLNPEMMKDDGLTINRENGKVSIETIYEGDEPLFTTSQSKAPKGDTGSVKDFSTPKDVKGEKLDIEDIQAEKGKPISEVLAEEYGVKDLDDDFFRLQLRRYSPKQLYEVAERISGLIAETNPDNPKAYAVTILKNTYGRASNKIAPPPTDQDYKPDYISKTEVKPEHESLTPEQVYDILTKPEKYTKVGETERIVEDQKVKVEEEGIPTKPKKEPTFFEQYRAVKTKAEKIAIIKSISERMEAMDSYFAKKGTSTKDVLIDKLSGVDNEHTALIQKVLDLGKTKLEEDSGLSVSRRENYVPRPRPDKVEEIIANPIRDVNFGDEVVDPPFFWYKSEGKVRDPILDSRVIQAYLIEGLKYTALDPKAKAEYDLSKEIKARVNTDYGEAAGIKVEGQGVRDLDFVQLVKDTMKANGVKPEDTKTYGNILNKKHWYTWTDVRGEEKNTSPEFYNDFVWPYKVAEIKSKRYVTEVAKMDESQLYNEWVSKRYFVPEQKFLTYNMDEVRLKLISQDYAINRSEAVQTFKDNVAKADFKGNNARTLVNDLFRDHVVRTLRSKVWGEDAMTAMRMNTSRALLGLNTTSPIMNIFEIKRALSVIDQDMWPVAIENAIKRRQAGEMPYTAKYGIDSRVNTQTYKVDPKTQPQAKPDRRAIYAVASDGLKKADPYLFWMFDQSEFLKDEFMLSALEAEGKRQGLEGEALGKYVRQGFDRYAIKYGPGQDIEAFLGDTTQSQILKTLFQYVHYSIKDAYLGVDQVRQLNKNPQARSYIKKYVALSIAQMILFKETLGVWGIGNTTGTPIDLANDVWQLIEPRDPDDARERRIPGLSPSGQFGIDILSFLATVPKDTEEAVGELKEDAAKFALTQIPAGNQLLRKTGIQAFLPQEVQDAIGGRKDNNLGYLPVKKRGFYTTGSGNIANEVSDDPLSTIKGLLLGPSYDPKRQEYYNALARDEEPYLNKDETSAYKQMTPEERSTYYESKQELDRQKKEIKDQAEAAKNEISVIPKAQAFVVPSTKIQREALKDVINEKIKSGVEVSDKELEFKYLYEAKELPSTNRYEKGIRDGKLWGQVTKIENDENLSDAQKAYLISQAGKELGYKPEAVQYHQIAKKNNDLKTLYMLDRLDQATTERETLDIILSGRIRIDDKVLASNGVIDNLVDEGYITYEQGKVLKKIEVTPEGKIKQTGRIPTSRGRSSSRSRSLKTLSSRLKTSPSSRIQLKPTSTKRIRISL